MVVRDRAVQTPAGVPDPALAAVKTYRYLRLAMIVLVLGLAACVLYEHGRTATDCWQTSISAYYYTPVQGFLVGALVTVGVCLVALQGNTAWEDVLLNLAGVCAPVVALVPIPDPGSCGSVLSGTGNRLVNIDNNMLGVLVAGGLALVVVGVLAHVSYLSGRQDRPGGVSIAGIWAVTALYLAGLAVYLWDRSWLLRYGHDYTATAMFVFIFANVCLNAWNLHRLHCAQRDPAPSLWRNRYTVVAVLMGLAVAANAVALLAGFDYWALTLEATLIALFAVFWVAQTIELWNQGLRRAPVTDGLSAGTTG